MAENTELMTVDNICNRVYVIRGQQVMLDYDLAELYGYEVKALNQQVKRNIDRFPEDFMFQLKKEEVPKEFSKSQIVTLNEKGDKRGTNIKKMPYAFTEQGIYMLATVLKGKLAEQQSIFIMRAFREMRHYIKQNQQFVTQVEMRLVTAKVSEISVQVAGVVDWKNKAEDSVNTRRHEFATLESIGMTKKQIRTVLLFEGCCYWSISFLLLFTLGTGIYIPIYLAFEQVASYAVFSYPIFPLSVVGLIILLICLVAPIITFRVDIKESVIERLRQDLI